MSPSSIPRLETARLILRAHRAEDLDACARMWADPIVTAETIGRPSKRAETWGRMVRYHGFWALLGYGYWALEEKATGAFVGDVGFMDALRDIDPPIAGIPEAGWVLGPAFHRRGYATEAMTTALAWADRTLAYVRTAALIAPQNVASIRLAEHLGYARAVDTTLDDAPTLLFYRNRYASST